MIRFTDVAPDAKPKKAATPAVPEREPPAHPAEADVAQPAKAPRKPRKAG